MQSRESVYANICTRRPHAYYDPGRDDPIKYMSSTNTRLKSPSYYHTQPYVNVIYFLFSNRLLRSISYSSARFFLICCAFVVFSGTSPVIFLSEP
jgi:hypothetical protein